MEFTIDRNDPEPVLPPATRMYGSTTVTGATIVARIIEDEADVRFGHLSNDTPISQFVGAEDCDDLAEFFTKLAEELRRNGENS